MKDRTAKYCAIVLIALTGVMACSVALYRVIRPREPHLELDRSRYPVWGPDLSAHNGVVDFDTLSAAGADFVFIKASEGDSFRDAAFAANYAGARRKGIPVGAYHFFRFDCDAGSQSKNFLGAIAGCNLDLPLVIDVEEWRNASATPTAIVVERIASMVSILKAHGYKVLIYTNKNGDARFVRGNFDNISGGDPELWICSFTDPPLNRRPWLFWQHSHKSTLPGVVGPVDLNTFNGSREQFKEWLKAQ